jgi:hypothetical protein
MTKSDWACWGGIAAAVLALVAANFLQALQHVG